MNDIYLEAVKSLQHEKKEIHNRQRDNWIKLFPEEALLDDANFHWPVLNVTISKEQVATIYTPIGNTEVPTEKLIGSKLRDKLTEFVSVWLDIHPLSFALDISFDLASFKTHLKGPTV